MPAAWAERGAPGSRSLASAARSDDWSGFGAMPLRPSEPSRPPRRGSRRAKRLRHRTRPELGAGLQTSSPMRRLPVRYPYVRPSLGSQYSCSKGEGVGIPVAKDAGSYARSLDLVLTQRSHRTPFAHAEHRANLRLRRRPARNAMQGERGCCRETSRKKTPTVRGEEDRRRSREGPMFGPGPASRGVNRRISGRGSEPSRQEAAPYA